MKIMLIGPPASGKGTVGALLSEKLHLPIFSVGELLRDIPENSIFYKPLHDSMDKGELAPDSIAAGVIRDELKSDKYQNGYILDGWMRDITQKDSFDPNVDYAVFIKVSPETSIKRISGRRFCLKDDFSCNIYTLPPQDPNHCDKCGGELVQRDDDREDVAKKRLDLFEKETLPVVEYYKNQGNLIEVGGEGTPGEVSNLILTALNNRDSN